MHISLSLIIHVIVNSRAKMVIHFSVTNDGAPILLFFYFLLI